MTYDKELSEFLKKERNILEVNEKIDEIAIKRANEILNELEFNLTIEMRALGIVLNALGKHIFEEVNDEDTLMLLGLGFEDHLDKSTSIYASLREKIKKAKEIEEV